ncbi:MAG: hypothetical protein IPJ67_05235 [Candidatus Moraniibacteriota bacterium]|nr:MAG: hypothetical protein IPJ67_05235 [Candidatus Moranbacteria bacterium]
MKKEDGYFLSAIGVFLSPFVFLWLKGVPVAYYNGPHDESFYAYIVAKFFVLIVVVFIFFGAYIVSCLIFDKKAYRAIVVLAALFSLYGLVFFTESEGDRMAKGCFFSPIPAKCGDITLTEEEILNEVNYRELSKRKARKLFLEAQKENQDYIILYSSKSEEDKTSEDKRLQAIHEGIVPYHERALRAVERMDN